MVLALQVCIIIHEEAILLISHLDHLSSRLRSIVHERESEKRSQILRFCAGYHSHIVKLALEVNELHMNITGHMALIWALSMGCTGNMLLRMVS
nr:unnamed protein product [Callosobruchus analis]